jgi:hypothetical protein
MIRWLVDRASRRSLEARGIRLSEEQLAAESDKSPGVLMASGYIAGGAIAGIVIAFLAGFADAFDTAVSKWSNEHNPFFAGAWSDLLSMLPFCLLMLALYLTGSEKLLGKGSAPGGQR